MSEPVLLAIRQFSARDQESFAQLSGDWNPMHMDPLAARRTAAGSPIVHGVHSLLWMAEVLGTIAEPGMSVEAIRAKFVKWLYVDQIAEMFLIHKEGSEVRLQVRANGLVLTTAIFSLGKRPIQASTYLDMGSEPANSRVAAERTLEEMANLRGFLNFSSQPQEIANAFPAATHILGMIKLAGLACSTRVVGMECPGLHSILAGLTVRFSANADHGPGLNYAVEAVDERFRSVKLRISGAGLSGTIDTFARVPPVAQATMAEIAKQITPGEFAGSRALIVGGSRGLGEFCAKALAAGGGKVAISYAAGKDEAENVSRQIAGWGGECHVLQYDVRRASSEQIGELKGTLNQCYYFATNPIFRQRRGVFSEAAFLEFSRFCVSGFHDLYTMLQEDCTGPLAIFYPSTISVEERPPGMTEYAMAKAAGEILCADLNRLRDGIRIVMSRLPRMLTDQTASVVPVKQASVAEVMLPIIREVHSSSKINP